MIELTLELFKNKCNSKICLRRTMINAKCRTESKQENCYTKYNKKQQSGGYMHQRPRTKIKAKIGKPLKRTPIKKSPRDRKYDVFRNDVWQRELKIDAPSAGYYADWKNACQFWRCLTDKEKIMFLDYLSGNEWMITTIEVAHIKGKGAFAELKYDPNNAVLCNHFTHSHLDTHKNPLSGKEMTDEQRSAWFERMKLTTKKNKSLEEVVF